MQRLHLALLGTFHLTTNDGATITLATDKVRGLLAYLAVEADRPHRREALAGLFWPDMPDVQARSNLRLSLHRLRQAVDEVVPGVSDQLLTVNRHVVQLHTAGLGRDHQRFQQALFACETHDHPQLERCDTCLQQLETAAALYQGEFLAGFSLDEGETFEDWLLVQREFLHQKALLALHTLTEIVAQRGDVEAALRYAQRQIALDPFYEAAYRQAMQVQALHGLRPQALSLYEQCRQLLADELGVEPAPETIHLWQQIKDGTLQAIPSRPAQTEIHHFPTPLTPFIGRQQELNEIMTALANPACRVLTLLGPGGMGKTRLSLQVGHQLAGGTRLYRDGVYFVPLANVSEENLLITTLAQRLGLRLEEQTTPRQQLLAYLRDKELLLVCDNFEQILSAAALIAEIVATAPQVQILLTSREPLNIQAEWRQVIRGLDVTGESAEAVELFQRSARRMVPNFQLRPGDGATVLALSQLVDGMPLALEIAAAWVRVMEPAAILRETKKSLDFLASPMRDMPERHQSVRAVLTQSWRMLSPQLQGVLARLALFPGGFTLDAALTILPDVTMLDIATLLDKSLLHGMPQERYEMHELLRQFARSQPQPPQSDFQQRYGHYYLSLMAQLGEALRGREPQSAITLTQAELEHIRQAWQWAVEGQAVADLRAAAAGLTRFYHLVGLYPEAQQRLLSTIQVVQTWPTSAEATLLRCELHAQVSHFLGQSGQYEAAIYHAQTTRQLAEPLAKVNWLAQAHCLEGEWCRHLSQFDEAQAHLQKALQLYAWPVPNRQVAYALNEMGFTHLKQSQYAAALTTFTQARQMYEAVGDQTETSTTLGNIGYAHQLKGDYALALDHLRDALTIAETIGYKQGIVKHALGLGSVYLDQGDIAAARLAYEKALQIAQGLGYVRGIINALIQVGNTYATQGQLQEADQWYQRARGQAETAGLRDLVALVIGKQAIILSHRGDNQAAIHHYEQAIQLWRDLNNQTELARNLSNLGNIYLRLGEYEQARQRYEAGLELGQMLGVRQLIANNLVKLGTVYKRLGQYERSLSYFQQALIINRELGHRTGMMQTVGSLGLVYFEQGEYEAAQQAYNQAYQLSQEMGDALSAAVWLINIGDVALRQEQYEAAQQVTQQAIDQFRQLKSERYLTDALLQQAEILLQRQQVEPARLILAEALRLGEPIGEQEVLFKGYLLRARLALALGQRDEAVAQLQTLLAAAADPAKQAHLHYLLWQMTGDASSQQTAIELYRTLLRQTPNYQYRQHLEALLSATLSN